MKNILIFGALFVAFIMIAGCVSLSDIKCQVKLNKEATGHASITFHSTTDLTDKLPSFFSNRHNVQYVKKGNDYYVDFDLQGINDITDFPD